MSVTRLLLAGMLCSSLLIANTLGQTAASLAAQTGDAPSVAPLWTNWGAERLALAGDGDAVWIGGQGGVLRWDKATGATQPYGAPEGLGLRRIQAIARDGAGDLWLGGDAGLSRLDTAQNWTHFTTENSTLWSDNITAIAVDGAGDLWLGHGPDAGVSRWRPTDPAVWFPNLAVAVETAYDQIKSTLHSNDLWTVAGDEVWVGALVFDGVQWHDRSPPHSGAPPALVRAAGPDAVYALAADGHTMWAWNGATWAQYTFPNTKVTALAVTAAGQAWIGWREALPSFPVLSARAGIDPLPPTPGEIVLDSPLAAPAPVAALLATNEGVWGVGPGWLFRPAAGLALLPHMPRLSDVVAATLTDREGRFVHSVSQWFDSLPWGALQRMDDGATVQLNDDVWQQLLDLSIVTAMEPHPGGGLWLAGLNSTRSAHPIVGPLRFEDGEWLAYDLPFAAEDVYVTDIYVQDAQVIWFAYFGSTPERSGALRLDDGGTPADPSDDQWTDFPLTVMHLSRLFIAVDAGGAPWLGNANSLYRHNGVAWQQAPVAAIYGGWCGLIPATDGTMFVETGNDCHETTGWRYDDIMIIRPEGSVDIKDMARLAQDEFSRLLTTTRHNSMWAVAPDGAIWYWNKGVELRLVRYDGVDAISYVLPYPVEPYATASYLAGPPGVDALNQVWFAGAGQLWRLTPAPEFRTSAQIMMLAPGDTQRRTVRVRSLLGYTGDVILSLHGLPDGISASLDDNTVSAGGATWLTISVAPTMTPGAYNGTLRAQDGAMMQQTSVVLHVAPAIHRTYTPLAFIP